MVDFQKGSPPSANAYVGLFIYFIIKRFTSLQDFESQKKKIQVKQLIYVAPGNILRSEMFGARN